MTSDGEFALAWRLTEAGLTGYALEHRFAPPRRWRFDFAWPDRKLAVEVEGGTFNRGRHTTGIGFEKDAEKYNEATLQGWRVLRVTPRMIADGRAMAMVERALG